MESAINSQFLSQIYEVLRFRRLLTVDESYQKLWPQVHSGIRNPFFTFVNRGTETHWVSQEMIHACITGVDQARMHDFTTERLLHLLKRSVRVAKM